MTTDVTSLTGITRPQSNSSIVNRGTTNVVAINSEVSEKLVQEIKQPTVVEVKVAAKQVNDFVKQLDRNLEFSVDESSGRVIITVREPETGKIIRQIPPEELLVIAKLVSENFASAPVPTGILLADEG
ncbi:MAG: flagellar protein FlaG [Gammaproteobacteria bacterium]|nr:flagellar protein FlaG [Gammaproteobacteria bacterium]